MQYRHGLMKLKVFLIRTDMHKYNFIYDLKSKKLK